MASRVERLRERIARGDPIGLRGHGVAGGGLLPALHAFAAAAAETVDVQQWVGPRKGAAICAALRLRKSKGGVSNALGEPDVAVLMNEAAAEAVDFAEGTGDALYLVNTWHSPQMIAARYRLGGTVVTIAGDELGEKFLGQPLASVAVFAALVRATGLVDPVAARRTLQARLVHRRVPRESVDAHLLLFDAAAEQLRIGEFPPQSAPRPSPYLRARAPGQRWSRVEFSDPGSKCDGCSLCVAQCPQEIVQFTADPAKGTLVFGARFTPSCSACLECVAACHLDLFRPAAEPQADVRAS